MPGKKPLFSSLAVPPVTGGKINWHAYLTLARLSQLAYSDRDEAIAGAEAVGATKSFLCESPISQALVASDDAAVAVAFRGSQDTNHYVSDALGFARQEFGGLMHAGFVNAVNSLYDFATAEARQLGAKKKTLWVTGHSLGGAMAAGFSLKATKDGDLRVDGIVTFGQPLVMDEGLCQFMLDHFQDRYVRVVNGKDFVTRLIDKYRHSGGRAKLIGDGEYEWEPPRIAVCAPAPEPEPEGRRAGRRQERRERREDRREERQSWTAHEPDPDLQLISEDEALAIEREMNQATPMMGAAPSADPGAAFGWNPFSRFTDHMIAGYVSRIEEIVNLKK